MSYSVVWDSSRKKYTRALEQISDIFDDWNTGKISVFWDDKSCICDNNTYMLNDLLASIRNITLTALSRPELVPGIPEQTFPVIFTSDETQEPDNAAFDEEEPEVY